MGVMNDDELRLELLRRVEEHREKVLALAVDLGSYIKDGVGGEDGLLVIETLGFMLGRLGASADKSGQLMMFQFILNLALDAGTNHYWDEQPQKPNR